MPRPVQRVGDANAVGGVILKGDPSVLVDGRPIAIFGAAITPHPCCGAKGCPPLHCKAKTTTTTGDVLVGGKPVVVFGDVDTCGHKRVGGSTSVIVG
jgi:uncharacterized Zn-binding protein involved in type VI secretion